MKEEPFKTGNHITLNFSDPKGTVKELIDYAIKNDLPHDYYFQSSRHIADKMLTRLNTLCYEHEKSMKGIEPEDIDHLQYHGVLFHACFSVFYKWFENNTDRMAKLMEKSK